MKVVDIDGKDTQRCIKSVMFLVAESKWIKKYRFRTMVCKVSFPISTPSQGKYQMKRMFQVVVVVFFF